MFVSYPSASIVLPTWCATSDRAEAPRDVELVCKDEMLELVRPDSPEHWAAARALVEEYAAQLGVDLGFQDFSHELSELSREYGPPHGRFLLARRDGAFVACGGVRRFDGRDCELKRLYVVPEMRGAQVGRAIVEALIAEAKEQGYEGMLLDTLPAMKAAQKLYADLGFVQVPAYRHNPVVGTTYWRLTLNAVSNTPQSSAGL